jgi:hypothetical protein
MYELKAMMEAFGHAWLPDYATSLVDFATSSPYEMYICPSLFHHAF